MKKILSILLIVLITMSLYVSVVFATEATQGEVPESTEGESLELTDEQMQELMAQYGQESETEQEKTKYFRAKVTDNGTQVEEEDSYYGTMIMQKCKVKVKDGENKGKEMDAKVILGYKDDPENISVAFKKGEDVYITFYEESDGTNVAYIVELDRTNVYIITAVILLVIIAAALLFKGIEVVGIIAYNALILACGISFMYQNNVNEILSLLCIVLAIIVGNVLILKKLKKESIVAILSVIVSTAITFGIFILMSKLLKLDGYVKNFDISALAILVTTIGITIDVTLRTINKSKDGKDFIETMKDVSEKMPSKYNMILLVWAGYFITNVISLQSYLSQNDYPTNFLNFGTVTVELVKFVMLIVSPIVAMPVSILLSKEILKTKKVIEQPKQVIEEK